MATTFKQEYTDLLKYYYYVGGMPEVVQSFADHCDFNEAREIQQRILAAYEQDFSKHAPKEAVPRIRMLWNNIPAQLTKENKKFIYGLIKEGSRVREYELAMLWLTDCGLVHKVHRVTTPGLPLKVYHEKFQPRLSMRTSMADYKKENWLLNLPLWAVGSISLE